MFLSVASCWEPAVKLSLGKDPICPEPRSLHPGAADAQRLCCLAWNCAIRTTRAAESTGSFPHVQPTDNRVTLTNRRSRAISWLPSWAAHLDWNAVTSDVGAFRCMASRVHSRRSRFMPPELQRVVRLTSWAEEERTRPALRYWLSRPPAERIAAVEYLRRQIDGSGARLRRVYRVLDCPWR